MHTYSHRVRYHEVDGQGYLFNARYLEIADVAFTELARALGLEITPTDENDFDPSVVTAALEYRSPARFDDVLDVDVTVTHVGRSSFSVVLTVTAGERHVNTIKLTYVNVDAPNANSRPLSPTAAAALRDIMDT